MIIANLVLDTIMGMGVVGVFGVGAAILGSRDPFGTIITNDDDLA